MKRLALLALSVALAACTRSPQEAPEAPAATPPAPAATAPAAAAAPASTGIDNTVLTGHHWKLDQAVDAKGQRLDALFVRSDLPVQLDFRDGRVNVSNTCNRMGGGYTLEGTRLTLANLASTMMACTDPKLMALDSAVGQQLQSPQTVALQGGTAPTLTLTSPTGDVLTFRGVPTAETRFGGPGETVFLEIAPNSRPCTHPDVPNRQCLQVREVHFDEQGVRKGDTPQEWQPLYQDIEGFDHVEGTRNVVRVKRFASGSKPAGEQVAYVLDMVVESEDVGAKR